ncbi:MAG: EamA family transporter [Ignavibacteriales bacterium]
MDYFTYALIGLVFWGIAPVFGKAGLVSLEPQVALAARSVVAAATAVVWAAVTGGIRSLPAAPVRSLGFIAGEAVCASVLGHLFYFKALKVGEASRVSPIMSSAPLLTLILAALLLGERLTAAKAAGAALIVAGIVLLRL